MRFFTFLMLVLLGAGVANAQITDGPQKTYYANGQVQEEVTYKNGQRNGPYKVYHENGKVKYEANFKNGQLHGWSKMYYEDGKLKDQAYFHNGVLRQ